VAHLAIIRRHASSWLADWLVTQMRELDEVKIMAQPHRSHPHPWRHSPGRRKRSSQLASTLRFPIEISL
jgi:hypothetical protein